MKTVALLLTLLLPALARADDLGIELLNKVRSGKPSLTVIANVPLANVVVHLEGGAKPLDWKSGPMKAGQKRRLDFEVAGGPQKLSGELRATYPKGEQREDAVMPLEFTAELVKPPVVTAKPEDIDLAARQVVLTSTRPTEFVRLVVRTEDGEVAEEKKVPFGGASGAAGERLTIDWSETGKRVLQLTFEVHDPDGFWGGIELFPWRIDVPHEEVVFASGQSAISAEEAPKLEKVLPELLAQVQRAVRFADVKLYVAGHTDTVGNEATNQGLSEARARSIATWFRQKGLRIPVLFVGVGESGQAVSTADEVDEPKNRRAEYILSVTEPPMPGSTRSGWKKL